MLVHCIYQQCCVITITLLTIKSNVERLLESKDDYHYSLHDDVSHNCTSNVAIRQQQCFGDTDGQKQNILGVVVGDHLKTSLSFEQIRGSNTNQKHWRNQKRLNQNDVFRLTEQKKQPLLQQCLLLCLLSLCTFRRSIFRSLLQGRTLWITEYLSLVLALFKVQTALDWLKR